MDIQPKPTRMLPNNQPKINRITLRCKCGHRIDAHTKRRGKCSAITNNEKNIHWMEFCECQKFQKR